MFSGECIAGPGGEPKWSVQEVVVVVVVGFLHCSL